MGSIPGLVSWFSIHFALNQRDLYLYAFIQHELKLFSPLYQRKHNPLAQRQLNIIAVQERIF